MADYPLSRRNASTGRAPVTPRPVTGAPPRDLNDQELSDAIDDDREHAQALLHAESRWCPECRAITLPNRRGICLFCDGLTIDLPAPAGQEPPAAAGACIVPDVPRAAPGRALDSARGTQGDHNEGERAA